MLVEDLNQLKGFLKKGGRTIVIGSGAMGLYTANELVKRGKHVLVIESGGTILGGFPSTSYSSIGMKHDGIKNGRSRTLGGTTNLWGGQLAEFQPIDFSGRDWMPESAWPVLFNEIAPYYRLTYENLGIEHEYQNDDKVCKSVLGEKPKFSEGIEFFLTRWLKIPNFADYYRKQISGNPNFQVLINHTVVGFDSIGEQITAVKVSDHKRQVHKINGDIIVVASGTIETARLLLHSASETNWACPWRHNKNIGARFHDHLGGRVAYVYPYNTKRFFENFCTIVFRNHKFQPKIRLNNEIIKADRLLSIHGMFTFESSVSENLTYLKQFVKAAIYRRNFSDLRYLPSNLFACGKYLLPLIWKYVYDHRIFVPSKSRISFMIQAEQTPRKESRITIDPSVIDENGLPRVILDWQFFEEDLLAIKQFTVRADRALRKAGLAQLKIIDDLYEEEPSFMQSLHDTYHQSGGALMGTSDRNGVVNRNLKVFGTENLYVAGSSTFRTGSGANSVFTALAFATRLVDHLTSNHEPN